MIDVDDWLVEDHPLHKIPRHERISYLVYCNHGAFDVYGWDIVAYENGHKLGLTRDEALELIQVYAFIRGLEAAGLEVLPKLTSFYKQYEDRQKQRR
jgi:hypothetical protein